MRIARRARTGRLVQARRFVCAIGGSGIAATERNGGDSEDDQSEHKHADPSEAAHSVTHSPSPVSAHHAAAALTGTVGLRLGNGRQTQGRKSEYLSLIHI